MITFVAVNVTLPATVFPSLHPSRTKRGLPLSLAGQRQAGHDDGADTLRRSSLSRDARHTSEAVLIGLVPAP
jgi:hypothetical protein